MFYEFINLEKVKIKDLKVPPCFQYNSLKNSTTSDFGLTDSPFFTDYKQSPSGNDQTSNSNIKIDDPLESYS